jgi:hypothetical protein
MNPSSSSMFRSLAQPPAAVRTISRRRARLSVHTCEWNCNATSACWTPGRCMRLSISLSRWSICALCSLLMNQTLRDTENMGGCACDWPVFCPLLRSKSLRVFRSLILCLRFGQTLELVSLHFTYAWYSNFCMYKWAVLLKHVTWEATVID